MPDAVYEASTSTNMHPPPKWVVSTPGKLISLNVDVHSDMVSVVLYT
jgi:hypothetical protein